MSAKFTRKYKVNEEQGEMQKSTYRCTLIYDSQPIPKSQQNCPHHHLRGSQVMYTSRVPQTHNGSTHGDLVLRNSPRASTLHFHSLQTLSNATDAKRMNSVSASADARDPQIQRYKTMGSRRRCPKLTKTNEVAEVKSCLKSVKMTSGRYRMKQLRCYQCPDNPCIYRSLLAISHT